MKWIIRFLYIIVFVACIALIILGQKDIGIAGLATMLVGLIGLLSLLAIYNKKYQ